MLRGQSRPHRSHSINMPSPIGRNDIHEPLHQIDLMSFLYHWLSLIEVVEFIGLIENTSSPCIFVLGLPFFNIFLSPNTP